MHPTEAELQSLIDEELGAPESDRLRAHLDQCGSCRERSQAMDLAARETGALLESLDRPPPRVSADDVIRRAERRRIPASRTPRGMLWAASVAGLVTAGIVAAAIVPGSPVRDVVERIVSGPEREPVAPDDVPPEPWSVQAGVALIATSGLEVEFAATQAVGSIELATADGDTAKVEVRDEAVPFVVGGGSIRVENVGARASYRISLPERTSDALITVGGHTVYHVSGNEVVLDEFERVGNARSIRFAALPPSE